MKTRMLLQGWLAASVVMLLALSGCNTGALSTGVVETPVLTATEAATVPASLPDVTTVDAEGNTRVEAAALETALAALPVTELTEAEAAGLRFMREEEKLAHDVYITLYETWGQPIFQNIANSEQTHTDTVLTLLERYGIEDPAAGNAVGVFADPALQTLYDQLVAQGKQSLSDALKVGAAIEEIDILDLEERSAQTDKADILTVYANLTKGSRNHLRSFVSTLSQRTGETYTPQYMSQEAYDAIIAGDIERGSSNNNRGPGGQRGGRGNG